MRVWLLFVRQGKVENPVDDYRMTTFDEKVVEMWSGTGLHDPDHRWYMVEVSVSPDRIVYK